MEESKQFTRRDFIGTMAVAGGALLACAKSAPKLDLPEMLKTAPDGPELKAGLVGCGGRGSGAMMDFIKAGPNLRVVALGDVFRTGWIRRASDWR